MVNLVICWSIEAIVCHTNLWTWDLFTLLPQIYLHTHNVYEKLTRLMCQWEEHCFIYLYVNQTNANTEKNALLIFYFFLSTIPLSRILRSVCFYKKTACVTVDQRGKSFSILFKPHTSTVAGVKGLSGEMCSVVLMCTLGGYSAPCRFDYY